MFLSESFSLTHPVFTSAWPWHLQHFCPLVTQKDTWDQPGWGLHYPCPAHLFPRPGSSEPSSPHPQKLE